MNIRAVDKCKNELSTSSLFSSPNLSICVLIQSGNLLFLTFFFFFFLLNSFPYISSDPGGSNLILQNLLWPCLWSNPLSLFLFLSLSHTHFVAQINGPWMSEYLLPSMVSRDHPKTQRKKEEEEKKKWDTHSLRGAPGSLSYWATCSNALWLHS